MSRALFATLLIVLAAAAPARAAGAPTGTPDKPALDAKVNACVTGADPAQRAVEFTGSMPALTQTKRMQMRFTLLQRRGLRGSFKKVAVPGWTDWEKSDPYRPGFIFTKRVEGLLAPAGYRATIAFRWYDKRGRLQRSASRTTPVCVQFDPRPDLLLSSFEVSAAGADQAVYTLGVTNVGRSRAGAFSAAVALGNVSVGSVGADGLDPSDTTLMTITGPRCARGSTVTIRLDPGDAVDEADESNDAVERDCPL